MGIGIAPKIETLNLSKGQSFVHDIKLGSETYPDGTTAAIIIKDDSEIVLATWHGTINGSVASFSEEVADTIPHGSKFDLFIYFQDGVNAKHSYGRVVRNENRYPLNPSQITTNYALQFTDTFDRTYVGKYWVPRISSTTISIHDNPGSTPNSLGPDFAFAKDASALWYAPLNTNSATITVSMVAAGNGQFTIVMCSDYSMSSWLGLQIEQNLVGYQYLRVVRGTAPTTSGTVPGSSTLQWHPNAGVLGIPANTWPGFVTNDTITVKYNDQSRTLSVFKNTSLTPVLTWTDTNNIIANGAGYRYIGVVWNAALFASGPEISSWAAKDGL